MLSQVPFRTFDQLGKHNSLSLYSAVLSTEEAW